MFLLILNVIPAHFSSKVKAEKPLHLYMEAVCRCKGFMKTKKEGDKNAKTKTRKSAKSVFRFYRK